MVFGLAADKLYRYMLGKEKKDNNTKEILDNFSKKNNIDFDTQISDDVSAFMSKPNKDKISKKLEKMSPEKREIFLKGLEADFSNDKPHIIAQPINALALHEAGHAKDYESHAKVKQLLSDNGARAANIAASFAPSKYALPIIIVGHAPKLVQESKASIVAYKELVDLYGKEEAKRRAKILWPALATYIVKVADDYILLKAFDKLILKLKNK